MGATLLYLWVGIIGNVSNLKILPIRYRIRPVTKAGRLVMDPVTRLALSQTVVAIIGIGLSVSRFMVIRTRPVTFIIMFIILSSVGKRRKFGST